MYLKKEMFEYSRKNIISSFMSDQEVMQFWLVEAEQRDNFKGVVNHSLSVNAKVSNTQGICSCKVQ